MNGMSGKNNVLGLGSHHNTFYGNMNKNHPQSRQQNNSLGSKGGTLSSLLNLSGKGTAMDALKVGGAGAAITDATDSTYVLTQADVDSKITVTASYTDDYGTDEVVTSLATHTISALEPTGTFSAFKDHVLSIFGDNNASASNSVSNAATALELSYTPYIDDQSQSGLMI